jgi:hypothetical protein
MHHIVANREYIQRDMDLFHAYQALSVSAEETVTDPWATEEEVIEWLAMNTNVRLTQAPSQSVEE